MLLQKPSDQFTMLNAESALRESSSFGTGLDLRIFKLCEIIPGPSVPRCANWARGCKSTCANMGPAHESTFTPGPPASLESQCVGALALKRKPNQKQERDSASGAQAEGRLGYQPASAAGRMARFAMPPGDAPP